jgi:predicted PurR-regulated permease PerM
MKREYFLVSLFFLITAISFYLFYELMIQFFVPITWAALLSILFFPLYGQVLRWVKRTWLASGLVCTIIVIIIVGPLTYLVIALVNEASAAVTAVNDLSKSGKLSEMISIDLPWIETIREKLDQYFDTSKINLDQLIKDAVNRISRIMVTQTSWVIANATKAVFYFFLMIFAMYYFFKEGKHILARIKRLMPLTPSQIDAAFGQLHDVIEATLYGGVAVALLQGLMGGILFAIVGIDSSVFWGAVMAFLAFIPIVGASLVYIPAGLILILGGAWGKGLAVLLVGGLLISQVDNWLRPYLISGRTSMHPLLLFFSIMGGIAMFGLLGIVMGPVVAAIFLTVLRIFELRLHPDEVSTDAAAIDSEAEG